MQSCKSKFTVILFGLALLIPAKYSVADEWEFVIAPYLLLPNISGDASLGRIEDIDLDVDFGDILSTLDLGGMVQLEARHDSGFGLVLNYAFMFLGEDTKGPRGFTNFDANVFQGILEAYGMYRFVFDWSTFDVYAGIRWWDISLDIAATAPLGRPIGRLSFVKDANWVDPVIGFRWFPRIANDWRLLMQADIGGFGISSDFSWNAMMGLLWDYSDSFSVALLYRALSVDYERGREGTPNRFAYKTITQGPILGFVFRF